MRAKKFQGIKVLAKTVLVWMVWAALAAGAIVFGPDVGASVYARVPHEEVVNWDGGGGVFTYYEKYTLAREHGITYRVEGMCISACTLMLGVMDRDQMCAAPHAMFGFHSAFYEDKFGNRVFSADGTNTAWAVYPPGLRDLLKSKGLDPNVDHPGLFWLTGEELSAFIPPCWMTHH